MAEQSPHYLVPTLGLEVALKVQDSEKLWSASQSKEQAEKRYSKGGQASLSPPPPGRLC